MAAVDGVVLPLRSRVQSSSKTPTSSWFIGLTWTNLYNIYYPTLEIISNRWSNLSSVKVGKGRKPDVPRKCEQGSSRGLDWRGPMASYDYHHNTPFEQMNYITTLGHSNRGVIYKPSCVLCLQHLSIIYKLLHNERFQQSQFPVGLVPHSWPPRQGRRLGSEHCHRRVN